MPLAKYCLIRLIYWIKINENSSNVMCFTLQALLFHFKIIHFELFALAFAIETMKFAIHSTLLGIGRALAFRSLSATVGTLQHTQTRANTLTAPRSRLGNQYKEECDRKKREAESKTILLNLHGSYYYFQTWAKYLDRRFSVVDDVSSWLRTRRRMWSETIPLDSMCFVM